MSFVKLMLLVGWIWYMVQIDFEMVGYTDSDWGGFIDDMI